MKVFLKFYSQQGIQIPCQALEFFVQHTENYQIQNTRFE
jgi:hypothetical protein